MALTKMPQVVYLLFEEAPWIVYPQLGKGDYPPLRGDAHMANKQKNESESSEDRHAFFVLVPDFASTTRIEVERGLWRCCIGSQAVAHAKACGVCNV